MNGITQMKYFYKIIILLILSILIPGCKDEIVDPPDDRKPAFYGKVIDQNENLLANVNVHYIYYMGVDVELRNAVIFYSVPSSQNVAVQIYDPFNKPIAKPIDSYLNAGQYMVNFNGDNFTNGIYRYVISGQTIYSEGSFPLITYDTGKLITTPALTTSGSTGEFVISHSIFGVGRKFQMQEIERELIVADSVKLVLHKDGYADIIKSIKLDTAKVIDQTFKMTKIN